VSRAELARRVPAVAAQIAGIRRAVLELTGARGTSAAMQADIALAVSEACTNVVMHAYLGGAVGAMTAEAYHADDELVVVVSDEGSGMVPRPDSPGLGLGLSLIAQLAKRVEVGVNAPTGTALRMTFAVGPAG
jgi:anti-sigma regulatory factor (Ser/Thr protein kinase)